MTFHTAEFQSEFDSYAAWAAQVREPQSEADRDLDAQASNSTPREYRNLTPSEQAEQVDEEWREQRAAEHDLRILHAWCDSNR